MTIKAFASYARKTLLSCASFLILLACVKAASPQRELLAFPGAGAIAPYVLRLKPSADCDDELFPIYINDETCIVQEDFDAGETDDVDALLAGRKLLSQSSFAFAGREEPTISELAHDTTYPGCLDNFWGCDFIVAKDTDGDGVADDDVPPPPPPPPPSGRGRRLLGEGEEIVSELIDFSTLLFTDVFFFG